MAAVMMTQFLEEVREPGSTTISPAKMADKLSLQLQELAANARVHRNTIRLHPESAKVQEHMRDLAKVISAASAVQSDFSKAIYWMKNTPIPAFRHKTASELIAEGRTDDVINYLESLQSGYVG
jgi:hypothetical protein